MREGDQGFIQHYRVPFAVQALWREGCSGNAWWFDRYGEEFRLLVSERGGAYICPADPAEAWRIYANPCGRAWRLTGWPARGESYRIEDATEEIGRLFACALMTLDDIAPVICSIATGAAAREEPHLPLALGGMEIPLAAEGWRRWRLAFGEGGLRLLCQDREIAVDAVPVVTERRGGIRRCAGVADIAMATHLLFEGRLAAGTVQQTAIDIALAAFERAQGTMQAIEQFEQRCRETASETITGETYGKR